MSDSVCPVIEIYTDEELLVNNHLILINQNSDYFSLFYKKMQIMKKEKTDKVIESIESKTLTAIDGIRGIKDDKVLTPFSGVHITNISNGSKVILNSIILLEGLKNGRNKKSVIDASQIGWNAMNYLLQVLAHYAKCGIVPKVYIGDKCLLNNKLPNGIKVIVNNSVELDSIAHLQRLLLAVRVSKSPFSAHIKSDRVYAIASQIATNNELGYEEDQTLPYPNLTADLGKVKFDLKFRNRVTIVTGNSGVGKTLISTILYGLRNDSNQSDLYNVEVFTRKNPLTPATFNNLKVRGMDLTRMLFVIDDEKSDISPALAKEVYKSGVQLLIFSGDYSQYIYGPENIAVLKNKDQKISLNYPCENKPDFFLTNRPHWSLEPEGIAVRETKPSNEEIVQKRETIAKMTTSDITRFFPTPEVEQMHASTECEDEFEKDFFTEENSDDLFDV